jgi:predicted MFS family arabinose efflux permease
LNEFAGYVAVSLSALATGYLAAAYHLRPEPFYPGIAFAVLGLAISFFFVRETKAHAQHEGNLGSKETLTASEVPSVPQAPAISFAQILLLTSWKDRALFAASQAGMVNNLNDGLVWGLLPIFLAASGLSVEQTAMIAAAYPGVWGLSQLLTGALSDRWGRKRMIAAGMWVQASGIGLFVIGNQFSVWMAGSILLGLGTALVYPTLLAAVSDVAHPEWRASAVGVYRLWRDGGYAVGALASGLLADLFGIPTAIATVGALTFLSGMIVVGVMYETLPGRS